MLRARWTRREKDANRFYHEVRIANSFCFTRCPATQDEIADSRRSFFCDAVWCQQSLGRAGEGRGLAFFGIGIGLLR